MLLKYYAHQSGLTLIEVLVSTAVATLLLTAAATVGFSSLSLNRNTISSANSQYELQSVMNIVTKELRRAGYSKNQENAKTAGGLRNIWFSGGTGTTDHTCAVFRYDRTPGSPSQLEPPGNGSTETTDVRGIRLASGKLELLTSATAINGGCSVTGTWEPISGSAFTITSFKLSYPAPPSGVLMDGSKIVNEVTVTIAATGKNGATQSLSEVVQLRNQPYLN
ncbi:prepilin-type N-terminal cleavage/methylation domain-containing protein [Chitinilyticum piscinae]|uniref:Prepilin-type N-terminal cleavage/methylation domain-containing protein n=1 Tax=Chitinilyticum piscinae TaxID=2866724 RepID=A0A8J7FJR3_9NEIS|nr:prepilin-type N-terminal cleavage/methylation domain-containing protein [Chitinilyticum piscinae]MBE9610443.1 prepilin-type N-terminal cleavage/methylation domain-containing protein [Chitinilyticum piscinae]